MDLFCLGKLIYGDMWSLHASIFICRQISTCKLSALKSLSQRYILTVFIDCAAVCGYCCLCKYSRSIGQRREDLLENFIFRDYIFNIIFWWRSDEEYHCRRQNDFLSLFDCWHNNRESARFYGEDFRTPLRKILHKKLLYYELYDTKYVEYGHSKGKRGRNPVHFDHPVSSDGRRIILKAFI